MKYSICPICSRQIANNSYNKHVAAHEKPQRYLRSVDHDGLNCKYCGRLCKNRNSLAQHEIRCKANDSTLKVIVPGNKLSHTAWNKGLTKETDERVAKTAENVSKTLQQKVTDGWKPFFATNDFWTEEMRAAPIAEIRLRNQTAPNHRNHPANKSLPASQNRHPSSRIVRHHIRPSRPVLRRNLPATIEMPGIFSGGCCQKI